MADETSLLKRGTKRARTRHGCTNCKTKRRKCDEIKPTCGRCTSRSEKCEWASRLTFRAENALGVEPSSLHRPPGRQPTRFRIKDVTAEVIRDYQHYNTGDDVDVSSDQSDGQQQQQQASTAPPNDQGTPFQEHFDWQHNPTFATAEPDLNTLPSAGYVSLPTPGNLESIWHSPVATTYLDDSVFLPGSAYLDAHSTFRNHLIQEVRSNVPTRQGTPDASRIDHVWGVDTNYTPNTSSHIPETSPRITAVEDPTSTNPSSSPPPLSPEEEFTLRKNWFDEVAPWIDKFDPERHFRHTLPVLARSHSHLHYSILALSARQLEQKTASKHTSKSLSLYQTAIQLVLPQLHTRSTPVIASCVVLCVLEMLSSSAKAWHQHLDGCAHLLEAVGINGFSGGVDQALFWCFARMDVCGGLIASSRTLIPVERWAGGMDVDSDVRRFRGDGGFNVHACEAVYLVAQILDLLSFHDNLAGRTGATPPVTPADAEETYVARWTRLWSHVSAWYAARPAEMLPISCFSTPACPFPRILYSNPAAMSGNQLHHTACILLLRHRPSGVTVTPKPNSIFWHARQICGISMSNDDHAAWTNAIQPLWIAGQWMSHESEQKAILRLLDKIEKQSGWSTKWRAEDLKEFWG